MSTVHHGGSLQIRFGALLYFISGVPVYYTTNEDSLPKVQVVFSLLTVLLSYGFLAVTSLLYILFLRYSDKDKSTANYNLALSGYFLVSFITVLVQSLISRKLVFILTENQTLEQKLNKCSTYPNSFNNFYSLFKTVLVVIILIVTVSDFYDTASEAIEDLEKMSIGIVITFLITMLAIPPITLFWVTIYTLALGLIIESESNEVIAHRMYRTYHQAQNVYTILPPVETFINRSASQSTQGSSPYNYRWGPYSPDFYRCQETMKTHFKVKRLRLKTNQWYHFTICWMLLCNAIYFPAFFIRSVINQPSRVSSKLDAFPIVASTFRSLMTALPIALNIWVKYTSSCHQVKTSHRIFVVPVPDLQIKKILGRFVQSTQDEYPDSPCVLFLLDSSLCVTLVETANLVLTSLVEPRSPQTMH